MSQVVAGSKELIDINLGVGEACYLLRQASREETALQTTGEKPGEIKTHLCFFLTHKCINHLGS